MTPTRWLSLFAALFLLCDPVLSQDDSASPPAQAEAATTADPRLESPEETMFTYLGAMERYREDRDAGALDEALICFDFAGVNERALQREFAIRMLQVLDRIKHVEHDDFFRYFIDPGGDAFIYFPQDRLAEHRRVKRLTEGTIMFAANDAGEWRFSAYTVAGLNALFRDVESLPPEFGEGGVPLTLSMLIRSKVPESRRRAPLLDIEYWQWLGILAVIFAGIVLDFAVRLALRIAWGRIDRHRGIDRDRSLIKKAVRPFGLVAAGSLWYGSLHLLGLPATALMVLLIAVRVILMLAGVMSAFRVVDLAGAWFAERAAQTRTKLDDLLVPLVGKTLKTFIAAFGLIYIAESFDIQILPLLTGLGIGGLAFAFAAKDTIENFFGSIAVILDQPFEVGDWVVIGDVEGTVEHLGLRSTRVRTFYNSIVTVPNSTLVRATVDNYGRRRFRRFKTHLALTYSTPPEKIEAFCEGVREIIRLHPYTRKDYFHVWLNKFGDSSLDVLVYMFHECPDWGTELRERHRFMLDTL
ncbi:MAG: mechanosensitive ion channel family protein, partial [Phycisphaerales bacterium]|nr:mechanosensitive ion channel family protein [Phycisphaerales bacterium]